MKPELFAKALLLLAACQSIRGRADTEPDAGPVTAETSRGTVAQAVEVVAPQAPPAASSAAPTPPPLPAPVGAPPPAVASDSAGAATQAGKLSPAVANELGQLGVSITPDGLQSLGGIPGSLLDASARMASRQTALAAVLNDDTVVKTFLQRADLQKACSDDAALQPILVHALGSPAARAFVASPAAITTLVESKLFRSFKACPAFRRFAARPGALATLGAGSPLVARVIRSRNFVRGLEQAKLRRP